jgi:hypothetical protein
MACFLPPKTKVGKVGRLASRFRIPIPPPIPCKQHHQPHEARCITRLDLQP